MGQIHKHKEHGPGADTVHVGRPRVHTGTDSVGMYEKDGTSTPINSGGNRRRLARYKKMTPTSQ